MQASKCNEPKLYGVLSLDVAEYEMAYGRLTRTVDFTQSCMLCLQLSSESAAPDGKNSQTLIPNLPPAEVRHYDVYMVEELSNISLCTYQLNLSEEAGV